MSTELIIGLVVVVVVVVALVVVVGRRSQERRVEGKRIEAREHRDEAEPAQLAELREAVDRLIEDRVAATTWPPHAILLALALAAAAGVWALVAIVAVLGGLVGMTGIVYEAELILVSERMLDARTGSEAP